MPLYIKEPRGGGGRPRRARQAGVLLPPGVGLPSFLVGEGEVGKRRKRERKGGGAAPLLVQFRLEGERCATALAAPPLLPLRPMRPN